MYRSLVIGIAAIGLVLGLGACAPNPAGPGPLGMVSGPAPAPMPPAPPPPAAPASLYQELGGQPAIEAVVDRLINNVVHDRRINRYFAHAHVPELRQGLIDQVCQATGGPCVYKGPPMRVVHHRMRITERAFNALVQDLVAAMDSLNVPKPLQQQLLAILGPLKVDIVNV